MELTGSKNRQGGVVIDVVPTIDTGAYASGDRLGSIHELTGALASEGGAAILESLTVIDAAAQKADMDILLFSELPTIASADNAAIDMTDANAAKCLGVVSIAAANYIDTASNSIGSVRGLKLLLKNTTAAPGSTSIWALPVIRANKTFGAASALKFRYGIA